MRIRDFLAMILVAFGLGMTPVVFTGCEEDAGNDLEDVGEDMQEGTEDLGEDIEEGVDDAGDDLGDDDVIE